MDLYSYVVRYDTGFAPNPYHGACTLATCKPKIRKTAQKGDYIAGFGSASKGRAGCLIYVMRVDEILTWNAYWHDRRLQAKKPVVDARDERADGDNIYRRTGVREWDQLPNPHHDCADISRDTDVDRVLVGHLFTYWGGDGPRVPAEYSGIVRQGPGHNRDKNRELAPGFLDWYHSLRGRGEYGVRGDSLDRKSRLGGGCGSRSSAASRVGDLAETSTVPRRLALLEDWAAAERYVAPSLRPLVEFLAAAGHPAPEVGCELVVGGRVVAEAELGWPAQGVAVLRPEGESDRASFEKAGWRVFAADAEGLAMRLAQALDGSRRPGDRQREAVFLEKH